MAMTTIKQGEILSVTATERCLIRVQELLHDLE